MFQLYLQSLQISPMSVKEAHLLGNCILSLIKNRFAPGSHNCRQSGEVLI